MMMVPSHAIRKGDCDDDDIKEMYVLKRTFDRYADYCVVDGANAFA